jgi:hypothetical protein
MEDTLLFNLAPEFQMTKSKHKQQSDRSLIMLRFASTSSANRQTGAYIQE